MMTKCWFVAVAVALSIWTGASAQTKSMVPPHAHILRNRDVLAMVKAGAKSADIITTIQASQCAFDIFPPVMDDLRRRGVPDVVLDFMVRVPNGPPVTASPLDLGDELPQIVRVKIPNGTEVNIETIHPVSSADVKEDGTISFMVVRPVVVDGVLAIARGAVARARVVRAKKAQTWGRPGSLYWEMEHVIAVDGTAVPLRLSNGSEGGNRAAQLAAGAAVTGALVFPYTAPIALVWGFKKGNDAVLRGSKQFSGVIDGEKEVLGIIPRKDTVTFHYADALKSKTANAPVTSFPRLSVKGGFQ